MKKVKRYQDGGITISPQQSPAPALPGMFGYSGSNNTYPFQSDASSSGTSSGSGVNQTFNIQPTAQSGEAQASPYKKGGKVKKMAKGGSVSSASKRADGCATKGKTRGKMV